MTLELGLMRTCRFPRLSALRMLFKQSLRTETRILADLRSNEGIYKSLPTGFALSLRVGQIGCRVNAVGGVLEEAKIDRKFSRRTLS